MLTPASAELVRRYRARGGFVLRRSWKAGVVALVFVVAFAAMFIDLALSDQPRPGYIGLVVLAPLMVVGLVFGVRQLLPGGSVVVDTDGVHLPRRDVAWSEIDRATIEVTSGWRGYRYLRLHLQDGATVDLPLLLSPSAHDQWFAVNHLLDE